MCSHSHQSPLEGNTDLNGLLLFCGVRIVAGWCVACCGLNQLCCGGVFLVFSLVAAPPRLRALEILKVSKSNSPKVFQSSRALKAAGTTLAGEPSTGFSEQIATIMNRFLHRIIRILAPSQFGEGRGGASFIEGFHKPYLTVPATF